MMSKVVQNLQPLMKIQQFYNHPILEYITTGDKISIIWIFLKHRWITDKNSPLCIFSAFQLLQHFSQDDENPVHAATKQKTMRIIMKILSNINNKLQFWITKQCNFISIFLHQTQRAKLKQNTRMYRTYMYV